MPAKVITNDFNALGQTDAGAGKFNITVRVQAASPITKGDVLVTGSGRKVARANAVAQKAFGVALRDANTDQWFDCVVFGYCQMKVLTGVTVGAALGPTATAGAADDSGATYYFATSMETSSATQLIEAFVTG